ncbi:MAG: hypothetical protein GY930_00105 [bacterium]|nr:hypothetical protein [bacterium]
MLDRKCKVLALGAFMALSACQSDFKVPPAWHLGGQTAAYHKGPLVAAGETGPRRFVMPLLEQRENWGKTSTAKAGWERLENMQGVQFEGDWKFSGRGPRAHELVILHAPEGSPRHGALSLLADLYGQAVQAQQIPYPARSIILLGTYPEVWQEQGLDRSKVVAEFFFLDSIEGPCSFWRSPDPGGSAETEVPANGLNLLTRLALVDVGMACRPWKSVEFAFDGGPAHGASYPDSVPRIYLAPGNSGVDPTRSDRPKVGELDRAALALWASAAAVAGARTTDLDRYLDSFLLEARFRHYEAGQAGESDQPWQEWLREARLWLRAVVLGLPLPK